MFCQRKTSLVLNERVKATQPPGTCQSAVATLAIASDPKSSSRVGGGVDYYFPGRDFSDFGDTATGHAHKPSDESMIRVMAW